jgi:hypothetical protein
MPKARREQLSVGQSKRKWTEPSRPLTKDVSAELNIITSTRDALVVWTWEWPAFLGWEDALGYAFYANHPETEAYDATRSTSTRTRTPHSNVIVFFCLVLGAHRRTRPPPSQPLSPLQTRWFACVPKAGKSVNLDPNLGPIGQLKLCKCEFDTDEDTDEDTVHIHKTPLCHVSAALYNVLDASSPNRDDIKKTLSPVFRALVAGDEYTVQAVVMSHVDALLPDELSDNEGTEAAEAATEAAAAGTEAAEAAVS